MRNNGFAAIAAIFLITVLSALSVFGQERPDKIDGDAARIRKPGREEILRWMLMVILLSQNTVYSYARVDLML